MKHNCTFKQRLQYLFDKAIAGGTFNLLFLIALITTSLVTAIATLLWLGIAPIEGQPEDYPGSFWAVLNVALDPGVVEDAGLAYRLVLLLAAVIGILIVSTLIGVLTAGIEAKFESLRRGRSFVIEDGHIIVLGWSSKIYTVIEELSCANENQKKACVVVLAERDKVSMEEDIATKTDSKLSISIICRTGNPTRIKDLSIVNPTAAKSIIVLQDNQSTSDSTSLKTCLALMNVFEGDITCPVAVEMQHDRSVDALVRIDSDIQPVLFGNIITRVLVQASRQPGLCDVYDEILSFYGCEIYFFQGHNVAGYSVATAIVGLQNCSLIGLLTDKDEIVLNPPANRLIDNTDGIIVIAEDDVPVQYTEPQISIEVIQTNALVIEPHSEQILIVGWNQNAEIFVNELNKLLHQDSLVTVLYNPKFSEGTSESILGLQNIKFKLHTGDTTNREFLNSVDLKIYDHIVLLGYRDKLDVDEADGESLLTLIQLRDLIQSEGLDVNIACELLNSHNHELVTTELNEDYVASEALVAKNLVQIAENYKIERVFKVLLTADDSEFHMRSARQYKCQSKVVKYVDLVVKGLEFGEIVIGYRKDCKCILNPRKDIELSLSENDSIIVLAED